ncbi:hypothetical protein BN7_2420 [Wickerhamomyces ciferrii]|uniref:Uncharacterized protein n=1 Tax=Wickerhamomyces ciferrii (strain ATCC 14091 / BCRC 22168 / CBS 111 / JCM 3599 / NBRC 0793 / NRRL Y-1031 F-60-10) TaxID=1206466 RepID=K0KCR3_WICCF|nr:uncharacterized protein BN7_2420 [Wickerhamomyces ciferrii]CCH42875.1 hypothetical protein BN7_2420 [Wickerhamomyces ciferrii]
MLMKLHLMPLVIQNDVEVEEPLAFNANPLVIQNDVEVEEPLAFDVNPLVIQNDDEVEEPLAFDVNPGAIQNDVEVEEPLAFNVNPLVVQHVDEILPPENHPLVAPPVIERLPPNGNDSPLSREERMAEKIFKDHKDYFENEIKKTLNSRRNFCKSKKKIESDKTQLYERLSKAKLHLYEEDFVTIDREATRYSLKDDKIKALYETLSNNT